MKGLPAAFANPAFGGFLDQKRTGSFTKAACQTVLELTSILSDTYIDTTNETLKKPLKEIFGTQFWGETPKRKEGMLSAVRQELLRYLRQVLVPDISFETYEPPLVSGVSGVNHVY